MLRTFSGDNIVLLAFIIKPVVENTSSLGVDVPITVFRSLRFSVWFSAFYYYLIRKDYENIWRITRKIEINKKQIWKFDLRSKYMSTAAARKFWKISLRRRRGGCVYFLSAAMARKFSKFAPSRRRRRRLSRSAYTSTYEWSKNGSYRFNVGIFFSRFNKYFAIFCSWDHRDT